MDVNCQLAGPAGPAAPADPRGGTPTVSDAQSTSSASPCTMLAAALRGRRMKLWPNSADRCMFMM